MQDVDGHGERPVEALTRRLIGGEIRALARAISLVEQGGPSGSELLAACRKKERRSLRVGVTGAPGVGKSTLVDALARVLRTEGLTVGVLAVDATSPLTGGSLLGDRIRMRGFEQDGGVYIRSMASRGAPGGVGRIAEEVCLVMEAADRHVVVIETVGVGQDEVAVCAIADVTVLVLAPGTGDDVQAMKAGLMDVADVFAVNKGDLPGASKVLADLAVMQGLAGRAVVQMVAATGEGTAELLVAVRQAVDSARATGRAVRRLRIRHDVEVDHLGIAVRSLEMARGFYEALGMAVSAVETVEREGVNVMMLGRGAGRIELLETLGEDTAVGRFLARRGEGLHHVALRVAGLEAVCTALASTGVRLIGGSVGVGAGGHRYRFVHPASTGGVLIELIEVSS